MARGRRGQLIWAAVVVVGVLLGAGSAWLVLSGAVRVSEERVGAWSIDLDRGGEDAGLYQRAVRRWWARVVTILVVALVVHMVVIVAAPRVIMSVAARRIEDKAGGTNVWLHAERLTP